MTWDVVFSDASKKFLKKLRDTALLDRLLAAAEKLIGGHGCRILQGRQQVDIAVCSLLPPGK